MSSRRSLAERLEGVRPRTVTPAPEPEAASDRVARLRRMIQRTGAGWQQSPPARTARPAGAPWQATDHDFPLAHPYGRSLLSGLLEVEEHDAARLHVVPDRATVDLRRALFLDTETSGLAGGTGTYAFLVGVGRVHENSFRVTQFLMRSMDGEPGMLDALAELADGYQHLVTFNGASFDMPLLETRYVMHRRRDPFRGMRHLDLFHVARRLFRQEGGSARLTQLEREVCGIERDGDIPGSRIPQVFFEYLRSGHHPAMQLVLSHNRHDIRSLAALSLGAAERVRDGWCCEDAEEEYRVGRHFADRQEPRRAAHRLEQALQAGLGGALRDRCLLELGRLHKRAGEWDQAMARFRAVTPADSREHVEALERLAKIEEHQRHDFARALLHTEDAEERLGRVDDLPDDARENFRVRRQRLEHKLNRR